MLLYDRQSGFRENHSCQTALIRLVDDWTSAVDKNEVVGTLLLDLSKAFDLVNHSLLLQKLHYYVSIWKNLPVHVQHSPSVNVFKARYLKWVQNQGIPE